MSAHPATLRLRARHLITVHCRPTFVVVDESGGVARVEAGAAATFSFLGIKLQPKRSLSRTPSGVRLAVTWVLYPRGDPKVNALDHLYFPHDARAYVVTAIKRYPRYLAYNLELRQ